jgi:mutator protein MutT
VAEASLIQVVAAVVERGGRYLLGRRPAEKRHGGLWEFPGGKMLEGESYLDAAHRELQEELALSASGAGATLFSARDAGSPFVINFVEITVDGEPHATEHSQIGWFELAQLREMALAPSDAAFVDWLAQQDP